MQKKLGIARCGLACCLCTENTDCTGCQPENCPDCSDKNWCENYACSQEKGLSHCYLCEEDCRKGMLAKIKPYGFTRFARQYGVEELYRCLERNEQNGVQYHKRGIYGDYDDFDDVESLIEFIKTGRR